jgi:hypothetical protein
MLHLLAKGLSLIATARRSSCRIAVLFCAGLTFSLSMSQTVSKVSLSPSSVVGGGSSAGTVTLSKKAGASGETITLSSSSVDATVPSSVTVPSGSATATFSISTHAVAAKATATIKAKLGSSSATDALTISPPALTGVSLNPTAVTGGATSTGTVNIGSAAPAAGLTVSLSSSTSSATVPSSVKILAGAESATFSISTKSVTAAISAKVTAKVGTSSESATLTIQSGPKLAGTYAGSFFSYSVGGSDFNMGPVNITVSSTGTVTGAAYNDGAGNTGQKTTVTGNLSSLGAASIKTVQSGKTTVSTGLWVFNEAGNLVVLLQNTSGGGVNYTIVTLNTSNRTLEYAGDYTGGALDTTNDLTQLTSFTISSNGSFSGTGVLTGESGAGTITGKVNTSGQGTYTVHNANGTTKSGDIYLAFNGEGVLDGYMTSSSGGSSIALTKSYAGFYTFKVGTGPTASTATINVSDTGVVTGGSTYGAYLVTGTVSSVGTVNIKATTVGGDSETVTLTGAMVPVVGSILGSGTFTGAGSGSWSAVGHASSGLVYAGSYTLVGGDSGLTFTIDAGGSISGTGTGGAAGAVVTGSVLSDGTITIIATPVGLSNALGTAILTGTLQLGSSLKSVTGSGSTMVLDGNSGSWTLTGTRG